MDNIERRMGILWVLLNISTELPETDKVVDLMAIIKRQYPSALRMWEKDFNIIDDKGKTIFKWTKQDKGK